MDRTARLHTLAAIRSLAEEIKKLVAEEFEPHNKTGETLSTLDVKVEGLRASVSIAGGAVYVEYGTAPHVVSPVFAQALHWTDEGGNEGFSMGHEVSGIEADPFLQRAMKRADVRKHLDRIAYLTFSEIHGSAHDPFGERYTGGEQPRQYERYSS